jgi:DNA mismatch endonuclease (patch repair protein)
MQTSYDQIHFKNMKDEQPYIRDKRSPTPKSASVSRVMSANKAKDTKPELALRKLLWLSGARGYRLNWKKVPGRPDIVYPGKKLAIFVHGCFWHRCPICTTSLPKHNTEFWRNKFDRNVARDHAKNMQLEELGWNVITVWECQLKKEPEKIVENILQEIASKT